jgi:RNA polymerase sigma-54 factor
MGRGSPQYIIPDVYITKVDGDYKVILNDDGLPKLRVSKLYRKLLKNKNGTSKDTKSYLKDKLNSALGSSRASTSGSERFSRSPPPS